MIIKSERIRNKISEFGLLIFVFLCTFCSVVFIFPQKDEYIFVESTEFNFFSIFDYAFHYGNGRILGNILCIIFSHLYFLKPFVVSITVTLVIFALKRNFCSHRNIFILPITIMVLFFTSQLNASTLLNFPSFTNYVLPSALFLLAMAILNDKIEIKRCVIKYFSLFFLGVSSCLFSENTTGIIFLFAVFAFLLKIISREKVAISNIVFLISTFTGCLIMICIPRMAGVSGKLAEYQAVTFLPENLLGNLLLATDIVNDFVCCFVIISFCLCYLSTNLRKINKFDVVCFFVISLYAAFSLLISNRENNVYVRVMILLFSVIYVVAVGILLMKLPLKKVSYIGCCFLLLTVASIVPMIFTNILSYRTFYITFIVLSCLSLTLFTSVLESDVVKCRVTETFKFVLTGLLVCFIVISSVIKLDNQAQYFSKYVFKNEKGNSEVSEEQITFDGCFEKYKYVIDNKYYFDPENSVIWPRETWLEALR